jgi:hypothetical protein
MIRGDGAEDKHACTGICVRAVRFDTGRAGNGTEKGARGDFLASGRRAASRARRDGAQVAATRKPEMETKQRNGRGVRHVAPAPRAVRLVVSAAWRRQLNAGRSGGAAGRVW